MDKEIRHLVAPIEVRTKDENEEKKTIGGYVVKWNQRSHLIYGEFYEKVARGAFSKSMETNNIKALWNHRSDYVLGSTKGQTLRLFEDETGLGFEIDLPNSSWGRDSFESIRRGDVDGVSFGFSVHNDSWQYLRDEDVYERTLLEVDLQEISPTPFPAYPDSQVAKRNLEELGISTREERKLEREQLDLELELLELEKRSSDNSSPAFKVGDRVKSALAVPHMPGQSGGEVREAVLTWVYGIVFDGMEEMGIHKWYVEDELKSESSDDDENMDM